MRFGPYEIQLLSDGSYRLDGGSMFGVVPRPLWERWHAPDELNRIEIALHCLLLRGGGRTIVVDTGMGDGWSERDLEIYGLRRPTGGLIESLAREGVAPEEVTDVVLTHLHFDHAGGAVSSESETPRANFPNATYWLQAQNLRWAQNPTERDRRSYRPDKWAPLLEEPGRMRLLEGSKEILPGLRVEVTNGHTPGMQAVIVGDSPGGTLLFASDLIALAAQVRLAWIQAFDLNPLLSLHEKRGLLTRAASEDWTLVFQHDVERPLGRVRGRDGDFELHAAGKGEPD